MSDSKEKVVIITGASRGIGSAISTHLLTHHHKTVLISRSHAPLDQFHYQFPDQVEVLAGDISDSKTKIAERAVEIALERWGRIDGVVVNHGTLDPVKKVADSSVEEWREAFGVNVFGGLALIQAALPHLRATHGRIVFTSSGASVTAYQGWGAYGASKAVLNHLALTLAVEEPDVTTISIRPGVVDTEMQREIRDVHVGAMSAKDGEKFAGLKSGGKLLRPEQPGHVIARLVVAGGKELSGKFVNWDDGSLEAFQEG